MNGPENSPKDPIPLHEILSDVDTVVEHQPDSERAANVRRRSLEAEVDELRDRRDGIYEVIATEGRSDQPVIDAVLDVTHAVEQVREELRQATSRHPSNPPK